MKSPARIFASDISIDVKPTSSLYAENNANDVSAAEAIAKPLPIAAVVLPTESSTSVFSLTFSGNHAISAIPPALSAIGPNASIAN